MALSEPRPSVRPLCSALESRPLTGPQKLYRCLGPYEALKGCIGDYAPVRSLGALSGSRPLNARKVLIGSSAPVMSFGALERLRHF